MLYELINMSDKITFEASSDQVATICTLYLGNGSFGCDNEQGETVCDLMAFGTEEMLKELYRKLDINPTTFIAENTKDVVACYRSFAICRISDRKAMMKIVEMGADKQKALAAWNEEKRTSLNDICQAAFDIAGRLEAAFCKPSQSEGQSSEAPVR